MQPLDLLIHFIGPLEKHHFPYMVTGSVAAIFFGAPRVTYDVDIVLQIGADRVDEFASLFPLAGYYCPPVETIQEELSRGGKPQFNLLHHASGFKADIYPASDEL